MITGKQGGVGSWGCLVRGPRPAFLGPQVSWKGNREGTQVSRIGGTPHARAELSEESEMRAGGGLPRAPGRLGRRRTQASDALTMSVHSSMKRMVMQPRGRGTEAVM